MSTSPNLFIIGAPKCGTTTLHYWLSTHPSIFMSNIKEPAFFCGFAHRSWQGPGAAVFTKHLVGDIAEYESLFVMGKGRKWRGEASTDYLWVEDVPYKIKRYCGRKETKIIVVLRNPIDRAFSEYSHLLREGRETLDFVSSMKVEDDRFVKCWQPLFYHTRRGLYSKGLERYFNEFGRENVKTILFDDLRDRPIEIYEDLCEFLNIHRFAPPVNSVLNRSGKPRLRTLHNFLKSDNPLIKYTKKVVGTEKAKRIRSLVDIINLKRINITDSERRYANTIFLKDIEETESLLGINLTKWKIL